MPRSLKILVHIRLITINSMAMAIISSSHLTHVGLHGSIMMWCTLIMRCYKAIIRGESGFFIPVPIGLIVLSILWSIRLSMRSSIRCPMGCPMRSSIVRDMGNSLRWTVRRSRNKNMSSQDNRRYLTLRYYRASDRSTNVAHSDILAQRTTLMRGRKGFQKCIRRSRV